MDLSNLQKFISNHSKFTDTLIKKLIIKKTNNKYNDVQFIIKSRFENWRVLVKFDEILEVDITDADKYSIWELDLKKEDEYYIFKPHPIYEEMGNFYIKAKKIEFIEL